MILIRFRVHTKFNQTFSTKSLCKFILSSSFQFQYHTLKSISVSHWIYFISCSLLRTSLLNLTFRIFSSLITFLIPDLFETIICFLVIPITFTPCCNSLSSFIYCLSYIWQSTPCLSTASDGVTVNIPNSWVYAQNRPQVPIPLKTRPSWKCRFLFVVGRIVSSRRNPKLSNLYFIPILCSFLREHPKSQTKIIFLSSKTLTL